MNLTRFADYGLRILIHLGLRDGDVVSIGEIAAAYGISENHLHKVANGLGQLGYVRAVRGRRGGLQLAQPPGRIVIGDVVRRTEASLAVVECMDGVPCPIRGPCRLEGMMDEAMKAFLSALDRYTLADLLHERREALARQLGGTTARGLPPRPACAVSDIQRPPGVAVR